MNKSSQVLKDLYQALDLEPGRDLITIDSGVEEAYQRSFFEMVRHKLGLESVYFYTPPNGRTAIPYIYFSRFEGEDPALISKELAELHRLAWNMSKAPLLFVVLPDGQVKIYNTYKAPDALNDGAVEYTAGLIDTLDIFSTVEQERRKLEAYRRSEFETGRYWLRNQSRFKLEERADYKFLEYLKVIRGKLLSALSTSAPLKTTTMVVNSLLGRAIFVKYLEDRKDSNGRNVFPDEFFARFREGAVCFIDLLTDKKATYDLFAYLSDKFNGDVFPVTDDEKRLIGVEHLKELEKYLIGQQDVRTGQLSLWRLYSFDVIPIEFISSIYEEFFHIQQRKSANINVRKGAHYTPHHLVSFLVDEVFPWNGKRTDFQVLDPACGSGIFLVEIYRRIISHWHQANPDQHLKPEQLKKLLTDNIFGVDLDSEAVRVAAFSLYLTLCDYLEPRQIWEDVTFPSLWDNNLFAYDFFDTDAPFLHKQYDLIIGNPPWDSELTFPGEKYREDREKEVPNREIAPDNQIALAFLWRAAELSKPTGEICLLMPSKGLLFNRSGTHRSFRSAFFETYHVKTIINFSASRRGLFQDAVGPGAAVFYTPEQPDIARPILYCTPKPSYSTEDQWQFFIDPQDIALLPREEVVENDVIWKVAMWGGPRDYALIKKLMGDSYQSLKNLCDKRKWIYAEGIIVGKPHNRIKNATYLIGKPFLEDSRNLPRFIIDGEGLPAFTMPEIQWPRPKKPEIFEGPHMLVKQSPLAGESSFRAALSMDDLVFKDAFVGVHTAKEDIDLLAKCCVVLNSRIPLYYALMSSRKWLVERDELQVKEVYNLPIPLDLDNISVSYDDLETLAFQNDFEDRVGKLVEEFYALTEDEQILIDDAIDYTLGYFRKIEEPRNTTYSEKDRDAFLEQYLCVARRILENSFGQSFQPILFSYSKEVPLRIVALELVEPSREMRTEISRERSMAALDKALTTVNKFLVEQRSPNLFIRRNVRVYIGKIIYIIKPDQRRYWTRATALRDADEIYADIVEAWRSV
ncbi:MAG: N-6 DNA methylase [Dehalococcoidia bacterium]|nr:N-6 DNA methylase [Dehalococcoidia bacterium]